MAKKPAASLKGISDHDLVARVRKQVSEICMLINEADRRGIEVVFSIKKNDPAVKGGYEVTQLDVRKEL